MNKRLVIITRIIINRKNFEHYKKTKEACHNAGHSIDDHFPDIRKMVKLGSEAKHQVENILHKITPLQTASYRLEYMGRNLNWHGFHGINGLFSS